MTHTLCNLLILLCAWNADVPSPTSAPASQPAEVIPPPPAVAHTAATQVISDFLKDVQENAAYADNAKSFVEKTRNTATQPDDHDFLNNALAVLSPEFAAGLELAEKEQHNKAADAFEKLASDKDPFLAVNSANLAATSLIDLEEFDRCLKLLNSVFKAHQPLDRYSISADHLYFTLGYCQIQMLHYGAAKSTLTNFLKEYPDAPQRLRVTATQILTEIDRRVPGRMGDVRDLLAYARKRIDHGSTDEDVSKRQNEAVALMNKMIKEAEDQEKSQSGGGKGGGSSKGGSQNQPSSGAKESRLPQAGSSGATELRKTRARPGDEWGKMPPKQREEIIQTLQKQFPSQYRELLEQYYKQLARDNSSS
jgi:tetratricopeptide (TPR) repeat protein